MNKDSNLPINSDNILKAISYYYPNALFTSKKLYKDVEVITLDIYDKIKYNIVINYKNNFFVVVPLKFFSTFEMKAKALKIQIKEFIENNSSIESIGIQTSSVCPHCKNPNSKLVRDCEWCGNQII